MTGALSALAILTAATIFGVIWRRRAGVFSDVVAREVPGSPPGATGAAAGDDAASGAGVASGPGAAGSDRAGSTGAESDGTGAHGTESDEAGADGTGSDGTGSADPGRVSAADLGTALGRRATLLQFSTAFCAPCRATRVILADVARTVDGVAHVEIDAESRLDLVRRLGVLRTPTVLVLDATGRIASRAAGRPRKVDVIAALGKVISA